ncbi:MULTISPECIES: acetate--CoA ligase family protein [Sphingobium]|uniref:acetate--CoA ligase family protein n=1 Tax=Sphingobium TaxID=165695 RepID=UPI0017B127C3|nr:MULTISPECIES: acetate--CoA ligase family protein [Sphingobium]MCW2362588.1 acyl-CoA synthetase (NDP forming) [Sphingobium sp. B10D3B]MCW2400732.1 acyl-CoA synthetase (NDP forming) [Sphingobium sp. B10D7B]MCW2407711.1 acyl-CoA synthetase (NDP forming) [Sphingobium xanthum]
MSATDLSPRIKPVRGADAVALFMRPRSIAVIGVSAKPKTAGRTVLANLQLNAFDGDVHVVGRAEGEIDGYPVTQSIDDLPEGVDLAVFTLPAAGVKDALEACVRRGVKAVTVFSSGFAEAGNRAGQDELVRIAYEGNVALLGPNCLGYTNLVKGLPIGFANARKVAKLAPDDPNPAIAMVSQSGGLMAYASTNLAARHLPMAYTVSTGNEAGIGIPDFIDFFAHDEATKVIALYLEEVRDPQAFLAAARRAQAAGKALVAIHPGRGEKGKAAIQSHTGALAGDYATMQLHLDRAGVVLVETLEEWVDVIELLARYPVAPTKGPGVLTFSGGFCAIAHDYFEALDMEMPALTEQTRSELAPQLPVFIPPRNPLDLGTQAIFQPELIPLGTNALMADGNVGSVLIAINSGTAASQRGYGPMFIDSLKGKDRPAIMAFPAPEMDADFEASVRANRLILSRSIERSMTALSRVTRHGRSLERSARSVTHTPFADLPTLGSGPQPEWLGKQLLSAMGIRVPAGGLATTLEEAEATGAKVGYPLAIKAQAGALAHKTEAGGVILGIRDADELRRAWNDLHANVARAQPGLVLDGVLVEKMAPKGLELMIGAKRDAKWGPVVLVGLGGIWVEALGDVRLLPVDMAQEDIVAELMKLRSAKLLKGFRGSPPVDVQAVAHTAALIGRLMETMPQIEEIDLNPVFVHPQGEGLTAVDALIITAAEGN